MDFLALHLNTQVNINKAKIRSFPGAHIGNGHDLMLATIKLKLKTWCFMKRPNIQFELGKLKMAEVFQAKVGGKFATPCILDREVIVCGE